MGRSYCDHCKAKLGTIDLVPIVSFFGLGAKCRFCKQPLSWQYPLVESATAVLFSFTFWYLAGSNTLSLSVLLYYLFLISVVEVVAVVDWKFSLIPTTFVFAASIVALFYNYFALSSPLFLDHIMAAFGTALFFLIIVVITRGRGMGQGDMVLAFLMGIVLGTTGVAVSVFLAFLLGAIVSIALILFKKRKFGQTVPFAPFLVTGFLLALFWAGPIVNWYLQVLY